MVQYSTAALDASFAALADPTRRGIVERLGRGPTSITDLARAFSMTLTGIMKHVRILESAELVTTAKAGRVRTCALGARRLEDEVAWIERFRRMQEERMDHLGRLVEGHAARSRPHRKGTRS